jgi:hypothetical protein
MHRLSSISLPAPKKSRLQPFSIQRTAEPQQEHLMKSHLSLLGLAVICSLLSVSLTGCAGDYYSPPFVYAPLPPIIPFFGWGGAGFYGGSYGNGYHYSHYSNGGYYNNSRGGSASWGGGSGSWHGSRGGSGSWHR